MEHELDDRVRAMIQEKMELGIPCSNQDCPLAMSCERFYDPLRSENLVSRNAPSSLVVYSVDRDNCHVLRRRLTGTPDVHREWQKTTKRHRRRGGNWK